LSAALVGPFNKLKVKVCGGESKSVATLVVKSIAPALIVLLEIGTSVGGLFMACPANVTMLMAGSA
jgi:hypothetical protein